MWLIRVTLIAMLVAFDLLLLPAVTHLPFYLPVGTSPARVEAWVQAWAIAPESSGWSLLRPVTNEDRAAQRTWVSLQPGLLVLATTGLSTKVRRARNAGAEPNRVPRAVRWRSGSKSLPEKKPLDIRKEAFAGGVLQSEVDTGLDGCWPEQVDPRNTMESRPPQASWGNESGK